MKKQTLLIFAAVITALVFNALVGGVIAYSIGKPVLIGALVVIAIGVGMNVVKHATGAKELKGGYALEGLAKEVYLAELLKKFRSNPQWLARARDLSGYVQNDKINFAEAGADPGIVEDYDHVDPLDIADDEDTPKDISLKSFSTERSKITETAQDTRAYNIMQDRVMRHVDALTQAILKYSAVQFAPAADGDYTPIIRTSGDTLNSRKKSKLEDILSLETAMNNMDVEGNRILVLNPTHLGDLKAQDVNLFKNFTPDQMQQGFPLFSFMCYVSTATPRYTTDGAPAIKAWTAADEDTDLKASFAFIENEVARAQGSVKLFKDLDTATYQASFISARVRFLAAKMRGKYVGALVSKTA